MVSHWAAKRTRAWLRASDCQKISSRRRPIDTFGANTWSVNCVWPARHRVTLFSAPEARQARRPMTPYPAGRAQDTVLWQFRCNTRTPRARRAATGMRYILRDNQTQVGYHWLCGFFQQYPKPASFRSNRSSVEVWISCPDALDRWTAHSPDSIGSASGMKHHSAVVVDRNDTSRTDHDSSQPADVCCIREGEARDPPVQ